MCTLKGGVTVNKFKVCDVILESYFIQRQCMHAARLNHLHIFFSKKL